MIKVETHPNQYRRTFHIKEKVAFKENNMYDDDINLESDKDKLGELGIKLVSRLFAILGVDSVTISKYDIGVGIAKAFDWEEDNLENAVKETILVTIDNFKNAKNQQDEKETALN